MVRVFTRAGYPTKAKIPLPSAKRTVKSRKNHDLRRLQESLKKKKNPNYFTVFKKKLRGQVPPTTSNRDIFLQMSVKLLEHH